ncbi:DNA mismatch repair endonuclease MutL [Desulfovibrio sp. OttesenSCG-928-G11]|nr:DNA mismatch repair endonuclease MutL [Desulfovibrio sp. OttesenSCG-928-G11]
MNKDPSGFERPIRLLPEALRNQIAAGEVVERPASVLKELVENSLDAGADNIAVVLEDGGQSLLLVRDNGLGVSAGELELAVTRHATSKVVSFEDLLRVTAYGFRGEALASIASVSDLTMRSARKGGGEGSFIRVRHGEIAASGPCALPSGTTVEVRELFANVPARLKFLKSPASELKRCKEHLCRLALAREDVAFSLSVRGGGGAERELLRFDRGQETRLRLLQMLPAQLVEDLTPFGREEGGLRVGGLTSPPRHAQARGDKILLYVNRRPVSNRLLLQAVREAYKGRLTSREYPQTLLFLDLDPREVDVNVHPAKSEVRFRDERAVFSAVLKALRAVLDRMPGASEQVFAAHVPPGGDEAGAAWPDASGAQPGKDARSGPGSFAERPARPQGFWGGMDRPPLLERRPGAFFDAGETLYVELPEPPPAADARGPAGDAGPAGVGDGPELFSSALYRDARPAALRESSAAYGAAGNGPGAGNGASAKGPGAGAYPVTVEAFTCLGQLADSYLILLRGDSLFLLDQHAAHERVLLNIIEKQTESASSQLLALPMDIALHPSEQELLEGLFSELTRLGFALRKDGDQLKVSGVPPLLGRARGLAFLRDLLSGRARGFDDIRHLMACRSAIKAGQTLTGDEAAELLRLWLQSPNCGFCPHGRPTILEFDPKTLEKLFKRKIG